MHLKDLMKTFFAMFWLSTYLQWSQIIAEKLPSKMIYWLVQSLKGFKASSNEHCNNVFIFSTFLLCLHMKFGKVKVVGRLQIPKKKHLTKRHLH